MTGEITFQQMQMIVAAGGGLILDATNMTPQIMQMLATAASTSGAQLIIQQAGHIPPQQLQMIASAGKGKVIFDLR